MAQVKDKYWVTHCQGFLRVYSFLLQLDRQENPSVFIFLMKCVLFIKTTSQVIKFIVWQSIIELMLTEKDTKITYARKTWHNYKINKD